VPWHDLVLIRLVVATPTRTDRTSEQAPPGLGTGGRSAA
jgi:hypothetical protein